MNKLLQLTTYGMKNLENSVTLTFANETIEKGITKINNVKGIFGYNGAGKSAIMTSVDFYKNIVCNPTFLAQDETKEQLDKLINYKTKEFFISATFEYHKNKVLKHYIKIKKSNLNSDYIISAEGYSISAGRTLSDKYVTIIEKKEHEIFINDKINSSDNLEYLKNIDLDYLSISQIILKSLLKRTDNDSDVEISNIETLILHCYFSIDNIDVFLLASDRHKNYCMDKKRIHNLIQKVEILKNQNEDSWIETYIDDDIVPIEDFDKYKKENLKLQKFIQIFKPEVLEIQPIPLKDKKFYHVRRLFVYKDYKVELEFESSGIKQLVKLFTYLMKCANGHTVFIDEIDTNINAVYFEKLISFYRNYGKGQLIFTSHNIEAMKTLKKQSKSILVLGVNNKIDTWIGKGNGSPVTDYTNGLIPNSPMNVEDFDFINIFYGDEQ